MQILCISVGPIHTTMGAIAFWSALVHSKKLVGRKAEFTQGYGKNPANWSRICPKFGCKPEIGPVWKCTIPFSCEQKRKVQFSFHFLQVHASAFHLLSWLLSPSILEQLSFLSVFLILRNKLLNFNFSEPQNSFFIINFITDGFF